MATAREPDGETSVSGSPLERDWFTFDASHRTRYEYLWNQFRANESGNAGAFSLRSTFRAAFSFDPVVFGAEVADSRIYPTDQDTPVDRTLVNPFDLLQAYVGVIVPNLFLRGAVGQLHAGRMTFDIGSRRLLARNSFRNTMEAFTGLDIEWAAPSEDVLRIFITLPVQQRPTSEDALRYNIARPDRERTDTLFWGAFYRSRSWAGELRSEAYVFGLHEGDARDGATSNRNLITPGLRLYREPDAGTLDFEVEAIVQTGTSRTSNRPYDQTDLRHLAFFIHGELGYTFDVAWKPRLVGQYDYASGDADPRDGRNGRFDTLFGASRFELGPTGIYDAYARSNMNSPELRVEVDPHEKVQASFDYRPAWLAHRRDVWPTAGVHDPLGASGSFIGHQIEGSVQWQVLSDTIALEAGFAHSWLGTFARSAPNASRSGNPTYVYVQATFEM